MENNRKKGTARVKFLKHLDEIKNFYQSGYCEKDVQKLAGLEHEMSYQTFRYNLRKFVKEDAGGKPQAGHTHLAALKEQEISGTDLMDKLHEIHGLINHFQREIRELKEMVVSYQQLADQQEVEFVGSLSS